MVLIRVFIGVFIATLPACGIVGVFEQRPPSAIITENIFPETNQDNKKVFIITDGNISNLHNQIIEELAMQNIEITRTQSLANMVLKVKVRFNGRIYMSEIPNVIEEDVSFTSVQNFESKAQLPEKKQEKTMIDKMLEDPSGMIIGFAIGAASSNPITLAPLGMAIGSGVNLGMSSAFQKTEHLTVLDIELHERAQKPIWYNEKRLHKKDEYSIRKYEYSEQTDWHIYKTRIIARGKTPNIHKIIAGIVI